VRKEAKENAKPKILKHSAQLAEKSLKEKKPVEERLIGFQKRYDGKK
jgi:hypothetical protein